MVTVIWYDKYHQITMEGHAGAAPRGEDLVCASCSILYHTLVANAMTWKDKGYLDDLRIKEIDGYAQVSWKPKSERVGDVLDVVVAGIVKGFELLARDYPEFVAFLFLGSSGGGVRDGNAAHDTMGAG